MLPIECISLIYEYKTGISLLALQSSIKSNNIQYPVIQRIFKSNDLLLISTLVENWHENMIIHNYVNYWSSARTFTVKLPTKNSLIQTAIEIRFQPTRDIIDYLLTCNLKNYTIFRILTFKGIYFTSDSNIDLIKYMIEKALELEDCKIQYQLEDILHQAVKLGHYECAKYICSLYPPNFFLLYEVPLNMTFEIKQLFVEYKIRFPYGYDICPLCNGISQKEDEDNYQKKDENSLCRCRFHYIDRNRILDQVIALEIGTHLRV